MEWSGGVDVGQMKVSVSDGWQEKRWCDRGGDKRTFEKCKGEGKKRQVPGMCVCLVWLAEVVQWSIEW